MNKIMPWTIAGILAAFVHYLYNMAPLWWLIRHCLGVKNFRFFLLPSDVSWINVWRLAAINTMTFVVEMFVVAVLTAIFWLRNKECTK